jgi:hypothetical protein
VAAVAKQFRNDLWAGQPFRPEVWVEKEALAGVFQRVCDELRVPLFACRGYTSQSEMHAAAMRLRGYKRDSGQTPVVFHFGDHDPSGVDMTRDIRDRLRLFMGGMKVERLALNMDQIEEYEPPPNPAKDTDSRFTGYSELYGDESWELDALEPSVLAALVSDRIADVRDDDAWQEACDEQDEARAALARVSERWDDVTAFVAD